MPAKDTVTGAGVQIIAEPADFAGITPLATGNWRMLGNGGEKSYLVACLRPQTHNITAWQILI
jgi:hypothetical protein